MGSPEIDESGNAESYGHRADGEALTSFYIINKYGTIIVYKRLPG